MILPIRSQGFPELITELGLQSPLQGPFWQFESTVLPIIDVRGLQNKPRSGPTLGPASTAGQIPTPAANTFLATTNAVLFQGNWALRLSWAFVNTSPNNAFIAFRRFNDTFTLVLEEEILDTVGDPALGERSVGAGYRDIVLQKPSFGQPWAIQNLQAMAAAGSVAWASIRAVYLGDFPVPQGF